MRASFDGRQTWIMLRFGIHGYEPQWLNGRDSIAAAHGRLLAGLHGSTLRHVWLVWDLGSDEWFTDAPVLLEFGTEQVEIDHQKFDDLSITWNSIDPVRAIEEPMTDLAWRSEPLPALAELPGRELRRVELLEWIGGAGDMASGSIAIGLEFSSKWLTIFNALDENGMTDDPPDEGYRRHLLEP